MWMSTAPCKSSRSRRDDSSGIRTSLGRIEAAATSVEDGGGLDFDQHIRMHQASNADGCDAGRTTRLGVLLDKLGASGKRFPPPFLAIHEIEQQVDDIVPRRAGRLDRLPDVIHRLQRLGSHVAFADDAVRADRRPSGHPEGLAASPTTAM